VFKDFIVTSVENTIKCFKHWQAAQTLNQESESEVISLHLKTNKIQNIYTLNVITIKHHKSDNIRLDQKVYKMNIAKSLIL
jgi:myo-inositol catabolism protein IolC